MAQNACKDGLSPKLIARFYWLNNLDALVTAEFRRAQAFAAEPDVLVLLRPIARQV